MLVLIWVLTYLIVAMAQTTEVRISSYEQRILEKYHFDSIWNRIFRRSKMITC